jgi:cytochrome b6-f complex iron-sulfur subunit
LLLGQSTVGILWFMYPRFKEGTFGGTFKFDPVRLPRVPDTAPASEPAGRFHVSYVSAGIVTLYGVCTHLGCLPKWVPTNNRFECPCHGSKYNLDGTYIEGPAPRGLDRFVTTIIFKDDTSVTMDAEGNPIPLGNYTVEDIKEISINTGSKIQLPPHP